MQVCKGMMSLTVPSYTGQVWSNTIHIHGRAHSSTPTETSRTSLRQRPYMLPACVQSPRSPFKTPGRFTSGLERSSYVGGTASVAFRSVNQLPQRPLVVWEIACVQH